MSHEFQNYLEKHESWRAELSFLDGLIGKTELEFSIKWGAPVYVLADKNIVGLGAFKSYVGLWFFQGALLKDEEKVLINAQEGKTKAMRQLRFDSLESIDEALVLGYIQEAIENQKHGRFIPAEKSIALPPLPEILAQALDNEKFLKKQFESLPTYKKKEYIEHILEAKKESTQIKRLKKSIGLIEQGVGLNDKYRRC